MFTDQDIMFNEHDFLKNVTLSVALRAATVADSARSPVEAPKNI